MRRKTFLIMALTLLLAAPHSQAEDAPHGPLQIPTQLTVSGNIDPALHGRRVFDLEQLRALGTVEITTTTDWTDGPQVFKGVPLKAIVRAVGARSPHVLVTALNDYQITVDLQDPATDYALVAFEQNGQPMRVRDKGPLWIVFPWSDHPELRSEKTNGWSVWQLKEFVVLPK